MIVAGTVMGSAIFLVPSAVAKALPHPLLIAAVWIVAGVLTWFGALAFAELGAMYPASGGQYVYLRESWGRLTAFLFGWTFLLVIRCGGTATLAVGFAIYVGHFVPLTPLGAKISAVGVIVLLTLVNCRGVRLGAAVQNIMTIAKVLGIAILIGSALFSSQPSAPRTRTAGISLDAGGTNRRTTQAREGHDNTDQATDRGAGRGAARHAVLAGGRRKSRGRTRSCLRKGPDHKSGGRRAAE